MVVAMTSLSLRSKSQKSPESPESSDRMEKDGITAVKLMTVTVHFAQSFFSSIPPPGIQEKNTEKKYTPITNIFFGLLLSRFCLRINYMHTALSLDKRKIRSFSSNPIRKIPAHLFKEMPLEQLQNITHENIEQMTAKQILVLLMCRSWLLSENLIQKISPQDIAQLTPACIRKVTPHTLKMMNNLQFKKITPSQIQAMRPVQMCAMTPEHIAEMSPQQIKALQPSHIAALNNEQIFAIITSGKLANMTKKQFSKIPPHIQEMLQHLKTPLFPKKKNEKKERPPHPTPT